MVLLWGKRHKEDTANQSVRSSHAFRMHVLPSSITRCHHLLGSSAAMIPSDVYTQLAVELMI